MQARRTPSAVTDAFGLDLLLHFGHALRCRYHLQPGFKVQRGGRSDATGRALDGSLFVLAHEFKGDFPSLILEIGKSARVLALVAGEVAILSDVLRGEATPDCLRRNGCRHAGHFGFHAVFPQAGLSVDLILGIDLEGGGECEKGRSVQNGAIHVILRELGKNEGGMISPDPEKRKDGVSWCLASVAEVGDNDLILSTTEPNKMSQRIISSIIEGRPLISCTKDTSVREACKTMTAKKISALAVLDQGRIVGIFTERDALSKILADGRDPDKTKISEVMVKEPEIVRAAMPLAYALHVMYQGGFRHVPIVNDDGVPVGMVSARDALGEDLVRLERELERFDTLVNPLN